MIAALLAAYKDAVNIAEHAGMLPVHHAALNGCVEVLKMIAEVDISNLSIVSPGEHGSVAHCAVENSRLDNLRYVHSIVPEILSIVNDNLESVLHPSVSPSPLSQLIHCCGQYRQDSIRLYNEKGGFYR